MRQTLIAAGIACAAFGGTAAAQTAAEGFSVNRFSPAERGSDWFALDSLDLRGHLRPAIGVLGEYAYKPLVIYETTPSGDLGDEKIRLIAGQLTLHAGGSLTFKDRLRAAISLPIVVAQGGTSGSVNGFDYTAPDGVRLGDLRLGGDVRLYGHHAEVVTIAVGAQLSLPTGDRDTYNGDDHVRANLHAQVAGDVGMFAYAGRLGMEYRALADTVDGSALGSEVFIAASVGVRALERRLLVGLEAYGATVFSDGDSFFSKRTSPLEGLIGAHYTAGDVRFGLGVGRGFTAAFGTPALRVLGNLEWAPGIRDKVVAADRDGDRILDKDDACPDVPGVADPDPKKHGCPPRGDRDHDGVFDDEDACPDMPGVRDPDPAKNGCPPDRDGDGILDLEDACPDVPGVRDPDPQKNGCPPETDRDGDTILDKDDACPDVPGPANPDPKKHGCPPVQIKDGQILILEQVKFKTGSDVILPESDVILGAVAQTMIDHPELERVEVQGHTDNVGGKKYNQGLSNRRSKSVVRWLTKHGIGRTRLVGKGFGLTVPIDTNDTPEGRQNNRRVEFHILETKK